MEYGSNREDDHRQAATDESSEHMDASPPATNESDYYSHEKNVGCFSDQRQQMQEHQNYDALSQTLGLGIIGGGRICSIEREHMFDKVVTPSDVGKLNRLVIPKQHAEKHFPLDSSSNEKGLLLNFEDLTGKSWRFRYSYWNSSQSYVMTKGWSRFVKEKKLDAGDTVSFKRGVGEAEKHRLFIDWRRRPITITPPVNMYSQFYRSAGSGIPSWSPMSFGPPPNRVLHPSFNFQTHHHQSNNNYYGYGISTGRNYMGQVVTNNASVVYLTSPDQGFGMAPGGGGGGGIRESVPLVFESVPVVQGKKMAAVAKKLRLFGVNMECGPISSDNSTTDEYEIHSSISPNVHLSQYPSSSTTLFLPSSSTRMYDDGTRPVSNKGKMSMSLDLDI